MLLHSLIAGLSFLFGAETAHAQVSNIITGIMGGGGAGAAVDIMERLQQAGRSLVVVVSVLMLVRAAAKMVGSVSEEKMEEGRRSVGTTIMGIILISLTYAIVGSFWNGGDHGIQGGATMLNQQVIGLVRWAQVLIGIMAVGMIIISAFKVLASFGKDDAGEEVKRAIIGGITGIVLVVFDTVIVTALGGNAAPGGGGATPEPIIAIVMRAVQNLLLYLGLLAVVLVVYAGIMMIVTVGSDDQYEKSKGLIVRVLIGLVIILFSYFVVGFLTDILFA